MTILTFVCLVLLACGKAEKPTATPRPPEPAIPDDFTAGGPYTGRITCLYSDGRYLYAGGWHTGVFRTADGTSWQEFNPGLQGYRDVMALAGDGRTVWAGTFQGEVFALQQEQWVLVHDFGDGPGAVVRALLPLGNALLAGTGAGVQVSADGGHSWTGLSPLRDVSCFIPSPFGGPEDFYFGTLGHGLGFCSADRTHPCYPVKQYEAGRTVNALVADRAGRRLYLAAEGDGVWVSSDGVVFESIPLHPTPVETYPIALALREATLVISLDGTGVLFKNTRTSDPLIKLSFPIAITAMTVHQGKLYYGTDGIGVFVETARGFAPANQGLLNYPANIVEEILQGARRGPEPQ